MKVVDPVCKMEIDDETAAASTVFEGKRYYFCCAACKDKFLNAPRKFIAPAVW
jgi:Cu+-exporting ATPase